VDPQRAAVARIVAGWAQQDPLVPRLGGDEPYGESWWKAQGLS
jgi:hypothetical protein